MTGTEHLFVHDDLEASEPRWLLDDRWDEVPDVGLAELAGPTGRVVVLAAHPDDETLGLGRLVHAWSRRAGVVGLLASRGEACVDHVLPRPDGLGARREAEWRTATARLGFADLHVLGLPDGRLAEHEDAVQEALATLIDPTSERGAVVLAAPWRLDPHPDHRAVGRAAARAAAEVGVPLLEYPVWATFWSEPTALDGARGRLVVVDHDRSDESAYAEALAAFASQLEPLAADLGPVLPAEMVIHHDRQLVVLPDRPGR